MGDRLLYRQWWSSGSTVSQIRTVVIFPLSKMRFCQIHARMFHLLQPTNPHRPTNPSHVTWVFLSFLRDSPYIEMRDAVENSKFVALRRSVLLMSQNQDIASKWLSTDEISPLYLANPSWLPRRVSPRRLNLLPNRQIHFRIPPVVDRNNSRNHTKCRSWKWKELPSLFTRWLLVKRVMQAYINRTWNIPDNPLNLSV
jgi:hypothetical protein